MKDLAAKAEKKRQVRTAFYVARRLGCRRKNSELFTAVAQALGRTWESHKGGGKICGYAMVMEYAERHGIGTAKAPKTAKPPIPAVAKDDFLMSFEWRRLRMIVLKKHGARCECCGATPNDGVTVINVDHVKPRKLFPELALVESNLQVLCGICNHGKGNWDQTDWRVQASS